jgi:hypothetical protein
MAYAHQGVELRPLPGLPPAVRAPVVANAAAPPGAPPPQQILLTRKATEALTRVEHLMDEASHALAAQAGTFGSERGDNTLTAASELKAAGTTRGD